MHVRPKGYIGIAALPGGIANVCVVREEKDVRGAAPGVPGDLIVRAVMSDRLLNRRFAEAKRVSDVAVLGPLAVDARAAGCPGLLLAGDAAGFIDPMTGDGLRFAIRGGMLAAEAALREITTGSPQYVALELARRREFAGKWRVNRALRALAGSPAGVAVAARLARYWDLPVRSLVAVAGDVALGRGTDAGMPASGIA
jgi:flavin-dependent dehydrogenase